MELKELLSGLKISIVVPVFNEEGNVEVVAQSLSKVLFDTDFDILFIDDGSSDRTLHLLKILHQENERINYLSFSRNFGHQAALKAGLDHSTGDCVITMDGDMEHPVDLLPEMLENWQKGFGVVVTSRGENKNLGIFKRLSSKLFYKIMNLLSEVELKPGSSDFRLLDRKVVNAIKQMPETPVFLRAMISWLGFSQHVIKYQPGHRFSGHSKYSKKKMINFSIEGITSFSIKPLRLASIVGLLLATLSMIYGCYAIYIKIFTDRSIEGWASLMATISFLGGTQMLMFGILGEYLGTIFMASKRRPIYILKERSND